jgi:hypothetical protein
MAMRCSLPSSLMSMVWPVCADHIAAS